MKKLLLASLLLSLLYSVPAGAQESSTTESVSQKLKSLTSDLIAELNNLKAISSAQTIELEKSRKQIASLQNQLAELEQQTQNLIAASTELKAELLKSKDLLKNLEQEFQAKLDDMRWQRNRAVLLGVLGIILAISL